MTGALPSRHDPRPFGGPYDDADESKMRANLAAVKRFLLLNPNVWFTTREIRLGAGLDPEAEVTARIRQLRSEFGEQQIPPSKRFPDGVYKYCLRLNEAPEVE